MGLRRELGYFGEQRIYANQVDMPALQNEKAPAIPRPLESADLAGCCLVAGDGFGGFFFGLGGHAVSVAVRLAVATCGTGRAKARPPTGAGLRRGDGDRLARRSWQAGGGEIRRNGLGDILQRADLNSGLLGLLQHQLFVDGADLGLLFVSLLAARAIFFGGGQRNVVLEMAHASGILGVNLERVLVRREVDALALGVDFMLAVGAVPLSDGRVL